MCVCAHYLQLLSNPSDKEEGEARAQLLKSDEARRLRSEAQSAFLEKDYYTAITLLDKILEVSPRLETDAKM